MSDDQLIDRIDKLDKSLMRPIYAFRLANAKLIDGDGRRRGTGPGSPPWEKGARTTAVKAAREIEHIIQDHATRCCTQHHTHVDPHRGCFLR